MRAFVTELSARQREVAKLVSEGLTSKEISGQLGVSVGTAETHVRRIYRKTGMNLAEAAYGVAGRDARAMTLEVEQVTDAHIAQWRATGHPYKVIAAAMAEWALKQERGTFLLDNDQFAGDLPIVASPSTWKRAKVFLRTVGVLEGDGPIRTA